MYIDDNLKSFAKVFSAASSFILWRLWHVIIIYKKERIYLGNNRLHKLNVKR